MIHMRFYLPTPRKRVSQHFADFIHHIYEDLDLEPVAVPEGYDHSWVEIRRRDMDFGDQTMLSVIVDRRNKLDPHKRSVIAAFITLRVMARLRNIGVVFEAGRDHLPSVDFEDLVSVGIIHGGMEGLNEYREGAMLGKMTRTDRIKKLHS